MTQRIAKVMWLVAALLAVSAPASAHTIGGANGFETELFIPGILLLIGSFIYRNTDKAKPGIATGILVVGILVLAASAVVPRAGGEAAANDLAVRIESPEDGATVKAGRKIAIEASVVGGEVADSATATEGGHFHIFVDDQLQEMLYANATQVELAPGTHTIRVEYTDPHHVSYDPPVETSVEVTAR